MLVPVRIKLEKYSEAKRGSAAGLEYHPEAAEAAADDLMS